MPAMMVKQTEMKETGGKTSSDSQMPEAAGRSPRMFALKVLPAPGGEDLQMHPTLTQPLFPPQIFLLSSPSLRIRSSSAVCATVVSLSTWQAKPPLTPRLLSRPPPPRPFLIAPRTPPKPMPPRERSPRTPQRRLLSWPSRPPTRLRRPRTRELASRRPRSPLPRLPRRRSRALL